MRQSRLTPLPVLEALETRCLLSATYACGPGFITVYGDPTAPCDVTIASGAESFTVAGASQVGLGNLPTLTDAQKVTVKYLATGQGGLFTFQAQTVPGHPLKALLLNGGPGDDDIRVSAGLIKDLTVFARDGDNLVSIGGATVDVIGEVNVKAGRDDDSITLSDGWFRGDIRIDPGPAVSGNQVAFGGGTFGTAGRSPSLLRVVGGKNADHVYFDGVATLHSEIVLDLHAGDDAVYIAADRAGYLSFANDVLIRTGKGDDHVEFATAAAPAFAAFAKHLTLLLGDANDTLLLTGGFADNSVTVSGTLDIDLGKSDALTGDRLGVGRDGIVTHLVLDGPDNVINCGLAGKKDTAHLNPQSIVLGPGSQTWIGKTRASRALVTPDLRADLAQALQGFTGDIGRLVLAMT